MSQKPTIGTVLLRTLAVVQALGILALTAAWLQGGAVAPAARTGQDPTAVVPANAPMRAVASPTTEAARDPALPDAAASAAAPTKEVRGTVVYGRVIDESGAEVEQGTVWFTGDNASKPLASVSVNARSPVFAIAGVSAGQISYRARGTGYKEKVDRVDIPDGVPQLRLDIVLTKAWLLTVRILTPDGKPLHQALGDASKERPMLRHVAAAAVVTATRPEGDFPPTPLREVDFGLGRWRSASGIEARMRGGPVLPKDVAGTLEIDDKQAVWVSAVLRNHVLASVPVEPGQADVTLTVGVEQVLQDLGTIRGRVVDGRTGEPVTGVRVGFGDLQSSGFGGMCDENGRFEVANLRPGLLDVEVQGQTLSAFRDLILLQPGQVLDLGDLPLWEFRAVKGRCEGMLGKADGCRVSYRPLDPPSHAAMRRHADSAQVAADGSFQLHLPDGRFLIRASGAGGAVAEIDTRTLRDAPLVLQLAKEADLRLDVQTNGEPWELALFDGANREVYRRDLRSGWKFALGFLPGDYRAELRDSRGTLHRRSIVLGDLGADLRVP